MFGHKNVYMVGELNKYIGYTFDKDVAKHYKKQYKHKKIIIKKIKLTEKIYQNLISDDEIYWIDYSNVYMNSSEEEYFHQSFNDFIVLVEQKLIELNRCTTYLKLTEKEEKQIALFIKYIFYKIRSSEECENDVVDVYDFTKAMDYFIKNVLDC